VGALGYVLGYALAGDHLRQGWSVVADSVNPLPVTREAWRDVALSAGVPGHTQPTWAEIVGHDYAPWDAEHLVLDMATTTPQAAVALIRAADPR